MKNRIEIFNYLHDTGISNLSFDFPNKKVSIDFLFWDDIQQKEVILKTVFSGVSKFNSEYSQNINFNVIGCHDANCEVVTENQYKVTFLFDFLKQAVAWKVEINFENLELEGGLSKEAFDYKFKRA